MLPAGHRPTQTSSWQRSVFEAGALSLNSDDNYMFKPCIVPAHSADITVNSLHNNNNNNKNNNNTNFYNAVVS